MENLTAYENESFRYVGRAVCQWLSAFMLFFVPQPTNGVHSLRLRCCDQAFAETSLAPTEICRGSWCYWDITTAISLESPTPWDNPHLSLLRMECGGSEHTLTLDIQSTESKAAEFWGWFQLVAAQLAEDFTNRQLLTVLDPQIRELNPSLSWEVGPGLVKPSQLVISPNLDRSLLAESRSIVSAAPALPQWEFHWCRQPKEWNYRLEMNSSEGGTSLRVDASTWTFVLLQYPDGAREVLLKGRNLPSLTDDERWQAAALVLEGVLGEELMLERVDDFELVDKFDRQFEAKARPISLLRHAMAGS